MGAGAFFLRPKLLRQPWGTTASEAGEATSGRGPVPRVRINILDKQTSSELQASILIRAGLQNRQYINCGDN